VTGTKFVFVPYRGAAPLNQDLVAGHIDINLGMAAAGYPLMRTGQIKAYATMAKSRWWAAPEIPTMEEAGIPGLYASFWHGLWVPKGTPKEVVERLNSAVRSALADPAVRRQFADQGQEIPAPEQLRRANAAVEPNHADMSNPGIIPASGGTPGRSGE
jgi:tripartite-type tricarboxylate transporter receptor subunit TctC